MDYFVQFQGGEWVVAATLDEASLVAASCPDDSPRIWIRDAELVGGARPISVGRPADPEPLIPTG